LVKKFLPSGIDIPLKNLADTRPEWICNVTLNNVVDAPRSFLLTPKECGQLELGDQYKISTYHLPVSVGEAVATSGAAVSLSMGQYSPSFAVRFVMWLLCLNLGEWMSFDIVSPTLSHTRRMVYALLVQVVTMYLPFALFVVRLIVPPSYPHICISILRVLVALTQFRDCCMGTQFHDLQRRGISTTSSTTTLQHWDWHGHRSFRGLSDLVSPGGEHVFNSGAVCCTPHNIRLVS
jgi:hypothetical protein